jgi:hypothetical protein
MSAAAAPAMQRQQAQRSEGEGSGAGGATAAGATGGIEIAPGVMFFSEFPPPPPLPPYHTSLNFSVTGRVRGCDPISFCWLIRNRLIAKRCYSNKSKKTTQVQFWQSYGILPVPYYKSVEIFLPPTHNQHVHKEFGACVTGQRAERPLTADVLALHSAPGPRPVEDKEQEKRGV